jgi:transposase
MSQFIRQINIETQKLLKRIHRQSSHHQVRQRCHCLLLKNQGIKISQLKVIFQVRMSWHRLRRGVFGEPLASEYATKKTQLEQLKQLDELGIIELYYLDETGFCLTPCVPYGWQPIGEYRAIPSSRSPRLNVLGIMNRRNHLEAYVSTQTINSDVIIACINTFFPQVDKPTVIVVDQASIHTSDMILSQLDEWRARNIEIFVLPSYSPPLNLIEILWRFMKYQWMKIDSYKSWQSLVDSVETMLREFGKKYVINFV